MIQKVNQVGPTTSNVTYLSSEFGYYIVINKLLNLVVPAPGDRFKRLYRHSSWPARGDSGKSLLSVFLIAVSYAYIYG